MTAGRIATAAALLAALLLPWVLRAIGADFYLSVASRIVVFAIAATSLNLLLGYGGMVSLGHAAFVGLGAYASGVLLSEGVLGAGWHLLLTVAVAGLAAAAIGAISLRTRGVYFIMITLAFAQMLYYLANSIKAWGGDEGLNITRRSAFGLGLDLKNDISFYFLVFGVLASVLWGMSRLVASRFGRAIQAIREDEIRAESIGFPTFGLRLLLFVIAGAVGGLAGALMVNQQNYVNPNLLHWTQSGTLMIMVILGGVGNLWGGVIGAAALLILEETLSAYTVHWQFYVGWVLLLIILFASRGLTGMFARRRPPG